MPRALTLSMLAVISIGGAGAGTLMGRSAIADINPVYFGDREDRFHADAVPFRSPTWTETQPAAYEAPTLVEGLGDGCLTCDAREIHVAEPTVSAAFEEWRPATPAPVEEPEPAEVTEAEPDPEMERIALYSSYAVSSDEMEKPDAETFASTQAP